MEAVSQSCFYRSNKNVNICVSFAVAVMFLRSSNNNNPAIFVVGGADFFFYSTTYPAVFGNQNPDPFTADQSAVFRFTERTSTDNLALIGQPGLITGIARFRMREDPRKERDIVLPHRFDIGEKMT